MKNSSLSLKMESVFGSEKIDVKCLTSELKWLDKTWKINEENQNLEPDKGMKKEEKCITACQATCQLDRPDYHATVSMIG